MLFPQQNEIRNLNDLSGFWAFQLDPSGQGQDDGWFNRLPEPRQIAVPGSWNEQFEDAFHYLDAAWYLRSFYLPPGWTDQRVFLRIGSANYFAKVWINGQAIGEHAGGHLPFEFDISGQVHNLPHGPDRGHFGLHDPVYRLPRSLDHHAETAPAKLKDPVKLLLVKLIMIFPPFPHGVLIVTDGIEFLFHVNLAAAVPSGQRQNSGLDIGLESNEAGMGGRGDTDPGADLFHETKTVFVVGNL